MGTVIAFPGPWKGAVPPRTIAIPHPTEGLRAALAAAQERPPRPAKDGASEDWAVPKYILFDLWHPPQGNDGAPECRTCPDGQLCTCEKCPGCRGSGNLVEARPDMGLCPDCGGRGTVGAGQA